MKNQQIYRPRSHRAPLRSRRAAVLAASLAAAVVMVACSSAGAGEEGAATNQAGTNQAGTNQSAAAQSPTDSSQPDTAQTEDSRGKTVTLITHDSFAIDPDTLTDFEKTSGITVKVLAQGDAGAMLSTVILTKDNPLGDAVFGIDNTFASKALNADVLVPYQSKLAENGSQHFAVDADHRLTAIDYGDVCVNIDHRYFTENQLPEPQTFEDLIKPEYKSLMVTEDAATSSPGLAFLFGTIAHFGTDGWQDYWQQLAGNDIKIDSGWTEAYTVDFSGSSGHGDRPLVVSYASSPPSEVGDDGAAPTSALLDTCFRQVEYAGVLNGAENPIAAGKVIDFLLSEQFQTELPALMYIYPVDESVPLPDDWASYAPPASDPATLDPADIDTHRQDWIADWSDLVRS